MTGTLFSELSAFCEVLEKTKKRKEIAHLAGLFLKGLPWDEVPPAVNLILGKAFPKRPLDVSGASIIELLPDLIGSDTRKYNESFSEAPDFGEAIRVLLEKSGFISLGERLTIKDVSLAFEKIAETVGTGSRLKKRELLSGLLRKASPLEAKYIVKNVIGEMRHGVDEGMILEALSSTLAIDGALLRRASMLTGDIGETAKTSIFEGAEGLKRIGLTLFRPIKPMLAEMAQSVSSVFDTAKDPFALEYKLDGVRVQIHKKVDRCRLFSRNLTDITASMPEIVDEIVRTVHSKEAILEGEVIAVDSEGAPRPFQVLMRRLGRVREVEKLKQEIPVRLYFFDILYKDSEVLIDIPYEDRWRVLEQASLRLVPRLIPVNSEEGEAFFRKAVEEGYEGVVAKTLSSFYTPGARGKAWLKIKKVVSLDLVIIAAEWGYGRRHGWLSNYHLAARDEKSGSYLPVGKTYKGLTDRELKEMTERLLNLKAGENRWAVFVKPEVVVEVLFSDVQKSPHYKSGFALRFARISRIRNDKSPREIDSIHAIEKIYRRQHT
ncbi:MAG: ATP-dependent DNA ligase [Betaproteobacteria bacterium]